MSAPIFPAATGTRSVVQPDNPFFVPPPHACAILADPPTDGLAGRRTDGSRQKWRSVNAAKRLFLDGSGTEAYSLRMAKRMLPIGFSSLRKIRELGCYYVDKTDHVRRLVEGGQYYFLSRPRRFGKTLLVDTLQKLFEGSEELFRGLAVHGKWDWSARHPVVRLGFGGGDFDSPDLVRRNVERQLAATSAAAVDRTWQRSNDAGGPCAGTALTSPSGVPHRCLH